MNANTKETNDVILTAQEENIITISTYRNVKKFHPEKLCINIGTEENPENYLEVQNRMIWKNLYCQEKKKEMPIVTDIIFHDSNSCVVKATLMDENDHILCTAFGSAAATEIDSFTDNRPTSYIELAETRAKGRVLSDAGFGTNMCGNDYLSHGVCEMPISLKTESNQEANDENSSDFEKLTIEEQVYKAFLAKMPYEPYKGKNIFEIIKLNSPEENSVEKLIQKLNWMCKNDLPKKVNREMPFSCSEWAKFILKYLTSKKSINPDERKTLLYVTKLYDSSEGLEN